MKTRQPQPSDSPFLSANRRSLASFVSLLCLLLCSVACGENEEEEAVSDAEYFGLVQGRCLGFRGGPSDLQEVTVGVEGAHEIRGLDTLELRYRINGVARRIEYLHAADGELRVVRREDLGSLSTDVELEPPYLLSRRPLHTSLDGPLQTDSIAHSVDGTTSPMEWSVSVSIDARESSNVPGHEEAIPTYRHYADVLVTDGEDSYMLNDVFSMAPEIGFTMLSLHGDEFPEARLVKVWDSEEGCIQIPRD